MAILQGGTVRTREVDTSQVTQQKGMELGLNPAPFSSISPAHLPQRRWEGNASWPGKSVLMNYNSLTPENLGTYNQLHQLVAL